MFVANYFNKFLSINLSLLIYLYLSISITFYLFVYLVNTMTVYVCEVPIFESNSSCYKSYVELQAMQISDIDLVSNFPYMIIN